MRVTERQQHLLLGMRETDPREWLNTAIKEVKKAEAQAQVSEWRETGYGWRLIPKRGN